jgi:WD40 repeat protein
MTWRGRGDWRLAAFAVVVAALVIGLGFVLRGAGLSDAANVAQLISLAPLVVGVANWAGVPFRRSAAGVPPELRVPSWAVGRPDELAQVTGALAGGRLAGITTGLSGAGGFGKTTLAKMACADPKIRKIFGDQVHLVTLGRDLRSPAAIAAKVNDLIKVITQGDASFTDPQAAGAQLGLLLNHGPRVLLVLDDVWEREQLYPFTHGGRRCARLVTTRVLGLLDGQGTMVRVDQMTPPQARELLTAGLPPLPEPMIKGLLDVTGRWPLLLRLVNKILADHGGFTSSEDLPTHAAALLDQLRARGPAAADDLTRDEYQHLDVNDPEDRAKAVWATIEASTSLLSGEDAERFAELGVFAEDEIIPFALAARLWQATAGLDDLRSSQTCSRLARLALISHPDDPVKGVAVHDVIRDYLRNRLEPQRLSVLNGLLLDAIATELPSTAPAGDAPRPGRTGTAWWELGENNRYLWDHLIEHLAGAGPPAEADAVACDLRWAGARLLRDGPAALAADLATAGSRRADRLRTAVNRASHLLGPTQPPGAVIDILHSRIAGDPDWGPQAAALRDHYPRPRLIPRWPPPDLPHPALRRTLTGRRNRVSAAAIAPDGTWLAAGSQDGTVRVWDAAGRERAAFAGHRNRVSAVVIAPDGSWLATGGQDGTVRIWDAAGQERFTLDGTRHEVSAVAVAPDGRWLAAGNWDGSVRIWETGTWKERAVPVRQHGVVSALVVAPDGSWLAAGGQDGTVRLWETGTWKERAPLTGHHDRISALAVAPDGSWLATGSHDATVRIWDMAVTQDHETSTEHSGNMLAVAAPPSGSWLATGTVNGAVGIWDSTGGPQRVALTRSQGPVLATAPDGSWLANGGRDGSVVIWDAVSWREFKALAGHHDMVSALAVAPAGSWLAACDVGGTIWVWDTAIWQQRAALVGHQGAVSSAAVAPDGSWLASCGQDGIVRIWATAVWRDTGHHGVVAAHLALSGHRGMVSSVAIAPDGSWLATGGQDGIVRIWDTVTGQEKASLGGHDGLVSAVAISPDGGWLATVSHDGTVWIRDTASWLECAQMRLDAAIRSATWLGSSALALGGEAGLYVFDFLTRELPVPDMGS